MSASMSYCTTKNCEQSVHFLNSERAKPAEIMHTSNKIIIFLQDLGLGCWIACHSITVWLQETVYLIHVARKIFVLMLKVIEAEHTIVKNFCQSEIQKLSKCITFLPFLMPLPTSSSCCPLWFVLICGYHETFVLYFICAMIYSRLG